MIFVEAKGESLISRAGVPNGKKNYVLLVDVRPLMKAPRVSSSISFSWSRKDRSTSVFRNSFMI
jgi:hypothetical protein